MLSRRSALLSSSAALAARSGSMPLCLHQTTSAAAGYRRSLEGYAKAGIRYVEVIPQHVLEFVKQDGMPAALNLTRGAAHPNVKSMFDFYHFWAGLSKFDDLDLIRPGEIPHVHFQDVPKIPRELLDNGTRAIPGDGVSPLARILQALKKK